MPSPNAPLTHIKPLVVLDAGVVIGVLDDEDPHFDSALAAIEACSAGDLRLPASAYAEVLVRPARLGQLPRARDAIRTLDIAIDPLSAEAAESAAELRAMHRGLRFADALVLGHAGIVGADLVLTTDRRLGAVDSRVEVVG
jgi:predicted nucleic acid-binding protein